MLQRQVTSIVDGHRLPLTASQSDRRLVKYSILNVISIATACHASDYARIVLTYRRQRPAIPVDNKCQIWYYAVEE
jgi:hypothetical protein